MSGDWFPYLIGALTIAASIYTSRRSSNSSERKDAADLAARREGRLDRLERTVTYLRQRDLWRQECQYRMEVALTSAGGTVPTMPPEPVPEPDLLGS